MTMRRRNASLPSASEMAACFRDTSTKSELRDRIENCYRELRKEVPVPGKNEPVVMERYGQIMAGLRAEEEALMSMLNAFCEGNASSVRGISARIARKPEASA